MVNKGKISGGTEITADCTDLPGFHVKMRWGYICNQSRTLYGFEGQKQRSEEEKILKQDMENYLGYSPDLGGIASSYWPQPIIDALSHGVEEGAVAQYCQSLKWFHQNSQECPLQRWECLILRKCQKSKSQNLSNL